MIRDKTPEKGQSATSPNQTVVSKGPENSANSVLTKSDEYTNAIVTGQPSINLGKTANPAQAQPGNSNQPAKFQEAELPQQIKPKEEEPATEKAVDELKAYQTRGLGDHKASFRADSTVQQLQSTAATNNNVFSGASSGADLREDKPKVVKTFGNLSVELLSLKIINGGQYLLTMNLTNRSSKNSVWVALPIDTKASLFDPNGFQFTGQNPTGISYATLYSFSYYVTGQSAHGPLPTGFFKPSTEIKPGDSATATIKFIGGARASPGVCNVQIEFVVGNDLVQGSPERSDAPNLIAKMEAK